MIDTEPQRNTPEGFGPTSEDITLYRELLAKLDNGEGLGFNPRFNAESVSKRIDDAIAGETGTLGLFTDSEEEQTETLGEVSALKLAQQRYVAGALGFRVGPTYFRKGIVGASIEYPDTSKLPERPRKGVDDVFRQPDGKPMSQVRVDAIYSAHFIAPIYFTDPSFKIPLAHYIS